MMKTNPLPPTNFAYLQTHDEQLVRLGMLAEKYFADDPNTCLLKLRQFRGAQAMLTALQTRKLTRLFMLYDVDRSGFIERSDYGMVAQMTAHAMGHQPDSSEYQALYYEYLVSWDNIRAAADSNTDDRLTLAEFLLGYDNLMAQRGCSRREWQSADHRAFRSTAPIGLHPSRPV